MLLHRITKGTTVYRVLLSMFYSFSYSLLNNNYFEVVTGYSALLALIQLKLQYFIGCYWEVDVGGIISENKKLKILLSSTLTGTHYIYFTKIYKIYY